MKCRTHTTIWLVIVLEVLGLVVLGLVITPVGWAFMYGVYRAFRPTPLYPSPVDARQEQARLQKKLWR